MGNTPSESGSVTLAPFSRKYMTASRFPNGTLNYAQDYSKLSLDEYATLFEVVDQQDFCGYDLSTAFLVFNGCAFSFAVATLFLVSIVPVFIRRHHWDAYLARVGAVSMTLTIIFFVVAFLLAGFVTAGVGQPSPLDCAYTNSQQSLSQAIRTGKLPDHAGGVLSASAYATLAIACLLILIVTWLALKDTMIGGDLEMPSASTAQAQNDASDAV